VQRRQVGVGLGDVGRLELTAHRRLAILAVGPRAVLRDRLARERRRRRQLRVGLGLLQRLKARAERRVLSLASGVGLRLLLDPSSRIAIGSRSLSLRDLRAS
jgi:hypothetical protein